MNPDPNISSSTRPRLHRVDHAEKLRSGAQSIAGTAGRRIDARCPSNSQRACLRWSLAPASTSSLVLCLSHRPADLSVAINKISNTAGSQSHAVLLSTPSAPAAASSAAGWAGLWLSPHGVTLISLFYIQVENEKSALSPACIRCRKASFCSFTQRFPDAGRRGLFAFVDTGYDSMWGGREPTPRRRDWCGLGRPVLRIRVATGGVPSHRLGGKRASWRKGSFEHQPFSWPGRRDWR